MTKRVLILLAALFCLLPIAAIAAPSAGDIPLYGKFEASFSIGIQHGNPYDPAVNNVEAVFTTSGHAPIRIPAFWDGHLWRVRFAPFVLGAYRMALYYNGAEIFPSSLTASSFDAVPSSDPGFIQADPANQQRFIFSNGKPYYPFGMDFAWQNGGEADYPQGLAVFGQNGLNWARIWMNNWDNKNLEWAASKSDNPPIGTYYHAAAQRWDSIMDNAAKDGIYVQMTLQHHGQYTAIVNPNWQDNPFNVANGGFLTNPDDFFTNPRAIALTKAKYRYIEARYGYSTHLFAYELFNEVQNIREASSHFQDVINWHNTMAAYIRSIDPYHHLITTSMSDPGSPLADGANIDFDQIHTYPPDIVSTLENLDLSQANRPVFVGEWGGGPDLGTPAGAAFLHDGIWAGLMTPTAGAAQYWAWDQVENDNQYGQFKSAADFLRRFDVADLGGGQKLDASATGNGPKGSLTFAPPLGWAPTTSLNISISNAGVVNGIAGVSSFLQGTGHRDMQSGPLQFSLAPTDPCKFIVHFGQVSHVGAHPTLSIDGGTPVELNFPAAGDNYDANGATLSVDVPAGQHVVSLGNTGIDWVVINQIEITNFAPPIGVIARGDTRGAAFWAYSRGGAGTPLPPGAVVTLNGLAPGAYTAHLWDCVADKALPLATVTATTDGLSIALPTAASDVAGVLTPGLSQ